MRQMPLRAGVGKSYQQKLSGKKPQEALMEEFIPGVMILTQNDVTAGKENPHVVLPLWGFMPSERRLSDFMTWQEMCLSGLVLLMKLMLMSTCLQ